jgi:broad specificity phosphatase PhoE
LNIVAKGSDTMTLDEILQDIHAMEEDLLMFERKYGVLTETFYQAYQNGEEPEDDAWVLDWNEWAGTYEILLQLQEMFHQAIHTLLQQETVPSLAHLIGRTARHEHLPIAA